MFGSLPAWVSITFRISAGLDPTKKLYGLRPESDAHASGTTDFDGAMLALHLAGSLVLYLGRNAEGGTETEP